MSFSPRQQHFLAVLFLCYGLYLLWNVHVDSQRQVEYRKLPELTPEAMPFYIAPPIDVNTADVVELQFLPRIGPVLADRIIAYRKQHGAFQTVDSLQEVYGIGPKTVQRLQFYLMINE